MISRASAADYRTVFLFWSVFWFGVGALTREVAMLLWRLWRRYGDVVTSLPSRRGLYIVLVIVAILTILQGAYFSYRSREEARCQTRINEKFLAVLKDRSDTNEADRKNISTMVEKVVNAKTREDTRQALDRYLAEKQRIDAQRKNLPYPDLEKQCGG